MLKGGEFFFKFKKEKGNATRRNRVLKPLYSTMEDSLFTCSM